MMVRSRFCRAFVLALALGAPACGGDDDDPPPAPDPIFPSTDTFDGTLTPFSARTHHFTVDNAGEVILQLSAVEPSDAVVGISLGTSNGFQCQVTVDANQAKLNNSILAVARTAGVLCARIYDPSDEGLPSTVTYQLQATHY